MASVWVVREHLYHGDLPPVCVVSGEAADGTVRVRFNSLPDWTWILLLFGVFPFLIATMFASETVRGEVPVRRTVVARYHQRKRSALALGALALTVIVLGAATGLTWLAWTAGTVLVASLVWHAATSLQFVDGRPDRTGSWVRLTRVHPRFVDALGSIDADAQA